MSEMNIKAQSGKLLAVAAAVVLAFFAYTLMPELITGKEVARDESIETFPVFIRTNGGMLEVGKVQYRKNFRLKKTIVLLGQELPFCSEQASISIDTHFTYRMRLAKVWPAEYRNGRLTIAAPALEPALPVAFDTSKMAEQLSKCWFMMGLSTRQDLLRSISTQLATAAKSPAQITYARKNGARETVQEFVRTWLLSQKGNDDLPRDVPIDVLFADE